MICYKRQLSNKNHFYLDIHQNIWKIKSVDLAMEILGLKRLYSMKMGRLTKTWKNRTKTNLMKTAKARNNQTVNNRSRTKIIANKSNWNQSPPAWCTKTELTARDWNKLWSDRAISISRRPTSPIKTWPHPRTCKTLPSTLPSAQTTNWRATTFTVTTPNARSFKSLSTIIMLSQWWPSWSLRRRIRRSRLNSSLRL